MNIVEPTTKGLPRHRALRLLHRNGLNPGDVAIVSLKNRYAIIYERPMTVIHGPTGSFPATRKVRLHRG